MFIFFFGLGFTTRHLHRREGIFMGEREKEDRITHSKAEIVAASRVIVDKNFDKISLKIKEQLGIFMATNTERYLNELVILGSELFRGSEEDELRALADALQFGELKETEGAIKLYGYVMGRIDVLTEFRKNNK